MRNCVLGIEWPEMGAGLYAIAFLLSPAFAFATQTEKKEPAASASVNEIVEVYFGWNSNKPASGVTAFRGFDAKHNSFSLSNAVLDLRATAGDVSARLALQTGDTPDIYYGAEASNDVRHVLEATMAWKAPWGAGLTFDGGIFLSPIGPESMLVKDNWNWSRSTLFYALPFYHTGFRLTYPITDRWSATAALYNGWNNVADTNGDKSISLQGLYTRPEKVTASILYFGGVERPRGASEGQPWRHLFDSHLTWTMNRRMAIQAHADMGLENTAFGRASWRAGALAARLKMTDQLFLAARADVLDETTPASSHGSAASIFFPTSRVTSFTGTFDVRPADHVALRLEFRRDAAKEPIYFKGGSATPSSQSQRTLTFGMTAWF
jgi:hypothetical protein